LGGYLLEKLREQGLNDKKAYIHRLMNKEEKKKEFLQLIENNDLIILSFPLYVDSLPSPVIRLMEYLSQNLQKGEIDLINKKGLVAISNCGFPESDQITTAMKICELFAQDVGFRWLGGIKVGGGESIHGRPLKERGKMVQNIIEGFDRVVDNIRRGEEISKEAIDLISKLMIPKKMYKIFGNMGWYFQAWKYRNFRLKKKPYKR
jgi:multimeric flavodoxin WrbA